MTIEGWKEAVRRIRDGDEKMAELTAQLLFEQDQAKNALREMGYGCIGTPWPEVVEEVRQVTR